MRVPGNMTLPDPGGKVRRNAVMKGAEANAQPMMEVPGGKNWRAVHWDSVRERGEAPPGKIDEGVSVCVGGVCVMAVDVGALWCRV